MTKKILFVLPLLFLVFFQSSSTSASYTQHWTADTPWATYQHDVQHTGRSPFIGPQNKPVLLWTDAKFPAGSSYVYRGKASIAPDGNLIVNATNRISRFDPVTRERLWEYFPYARSAGVPLLDQDGWIYWGYGPMIARFGMDGAIDWTAELSSFLGYAPSAQFTKNGNLLYVKDGIWSFDRLGHLNWFIEYGPFYLNMVPAIDQNGMIYEQVAIDNLALLCAHYEDGSYAWCAQMPGRKHGDTMGMPMIDSEGAIYATVNRYLSKFSADGDVFWTLPAGINEGEFDSFSEAMALAPSGNIYAFFNATNNGYLFAISPDGEILWQQSFSTNPVSHIGPYLADPLLTDRSGSVYFCLQNSHCYGVGPQGNILWDYALPVGESDTTTNGTQPVLLQDGMLWLADTTGGFYLLADPQLAPVLQITEQSVVVHAAPGTTDIPQAVHITSSIPGASFAVEQPPVDWLSLSAPRGTTNQEFAFTVHASRMPVGAYSTALHFKPDGWIGNDVTIPIVFYNGVTPNYLPFLVNKTKPAILYVSEYFDEVQIASIRSDGQGRTPLFTLQNPKNIMETVFSPDGSKVALWIYESNQYRVDVYSTYTGTMITTVGPNVSLPYWSGDSRGFALTINVNGKHPLFVWNAATNTLKQVPNSPDTVYDVKFSPDGNWIAYKINTSAGMIRVDGSEQRILAHPTRTELIPVEWSPDGRYLLLGQYQKEEIWRYEQSTGKMQLILPILPVPDSIHFSPDGSRLVYTIASDLYVANSDGSGARNITQSPHEDSDPHWSPDGSSIVFTCQSQCYNAPFDSDEDIYSINFDGTNITQITVNQNYDRNPHWPKNVP